MDKQLQTDMQKRMESALTVLNHHFHKLRTGKAHSSLVEDIKVEYYGNLTPLQQMASIRTPDARTLSIAPWDKSQIEHVQKALQTSPLGLVPNVKDNEILINLPPLTEETRKDYQRQARNEAEQARIAIRNVRRDTLHKIKDLELSEDEEKRMHNEADKITEDFIKRVDDLLHQKEEDLLSF